MRRRPLGAVLFDLDGTLAETRRDIAAAVNLVLAERGLPHLGVETVSLHVGRGSRVLMAGCLRAATGIEPLVEDVDRAYQRFHDHYMEHLFDTTVLYEGILPMLERLCSRGIAMAVVSNKPAVPTRAIVEGLGMAAFFPVVLGGESLPERKPSPVPLQHACAALGVDAARTAMVGDSSIDVEAARAAGTAAVAVTWGFASREDLAQTAPDFLADTAAQLADWLVGEDHP